MNRLSVGVCLRAGQTTAAVPDNEQPGPSRRKRGPSMSDSMPLYMLCKEDLDSMDKEVRRPGPPLSAGVIPPV